MPLKGFTRNIKPLEVFNEEQLESIHKGMLDVLEITGLRYESEKALKIFQSNDCNVDFDEKRVRFPSYIVEEMIRMCPSSFTVRSRNPNNNIRIGGNTLYFSDMPGLRILDLETWKTRRATKKERDDTLKVLDALDSVHLLTSYAPYFEVEDIPPLMSIPECFAAKLRNSSKVSWEGYQKDCEIYVIEMSKIAGQDVIGISLPSSPLSYYSDACESAIRFAKEGLPINIACGSVMGGSSPVTVAGSIISANAEMFGAIALAQMVRPGTKITVQGSVLPINMQSGAPLFGVTSAFLYLAGALQTWRRYKVPTISPTGWINSKKIDIQCGYERSIGALISALAGSNVQGLHGGVHGELAHHPVQAIIDDDIAFTIGNFIEGIKVNEDSLAVNIIEKVGPIPGSFLAEKHTRDFYKEGPHIPKSADILTYSEWEKTGEKDAITLAKERMEQILKDHVQECPLTAEQDREIEKILKKARSFYKDK